MSDTAASLSTVSIDGSAGQPGADPRALPGTAPVAGRRAHLPGMPPAGLRRGGHARFRRPVQLRVAMIPVVIAVAGVIILGVAAQRWPADLVSGVAAGLLGGWVAFTLRLALNGTPYGFDGLGGDAGRMTAMANRYSSALNSSDGIVSAGPLALPAVVPLAGGAAGGRRWLTCQAWRLLSARPRPSRCRSRWSLASRCGACSSQARSPWR